MRIHYLLEEADPSYLLAQDDPAFPFLNSASARFAGTYPGEILAAQGHDVSYSFVNKNTGVRNDIDFQSGDIVVCIRNYFQQMVDTAKCAKDAGAIIIMQQNDPHILSTSDDLAEVRNSHFQLLKMADGVIACSPKLAELCEKYNQNITVIFDGLDTEYAKPHFNVSKYMQGERPLKLATACYAHNHGDILDSLPALQEFAAENGAVEYTIVTKAARADQSHHGSDYNLLKNYEAGNGLSIKLVDYSPVVTAKAIEAADIILIQEDSGHRTGYKKEWYPNKSNGRGAAAVWAGKPFICPRDILSYQPFLKNKGGYNVEGNIAKTLDNILFLEAGIVDAHVVNGQDMVRSINSSEVIAAQQLAFFQKILGNKL